jgi:hypothetical protein
MKSRVYDRPPRIAQTHKGAGDDWLKFICDLQSLQTRAHALGLHQTGKKLNEAMNVGGFEQADIDKRSAKSLRIQKAEPTP